MNGIDALSWRASVFTQRSVVYSLRYNIVRQSAIVVYAMGNDKSLTCFLMKP